MVACPQLLLQSVSCGVGPNRLDTEAETPAWRKFLAQFADPLIYLLLAAIVVSVVAWALEGAEGIPIEAIVIALIWCSEASVTSRRNVAVPLP